MASRHGHSYTNVNNHDNSRSHLGDVYNNYGPSPDQQAFNAVLESLRYDGMDDRLNRLNSAERGTFEWALAERNVGLIPRCQHGNEKGKQDDGGRERDSGSGSDEDEAHMDYEDDGQHTDDDDYHSDSSSDDPWQRIRNVGETFTKWLASDDEEGNLFCFMGKPGSGKSTLMYESLLRNFANEHFG